jgi:hypothetical protein
MKHCSQAGDLLSWSQLQAPEGKTMTAKQQNTFPRLYRKAPEEGPTIPEPDAAIAELRDEQATDRGRIDTLEKGLQELRDEIDRLRPEE